jgi:hypothetical protein
MKSELTRFCNFTKVMQLRAVSLEVRFSFGCLGEYGVLIADYGIPSVRTLTVEAK